jgi:hypothetical protein
MDQLALVQNNFRKASEMVSGWAQAMTVLHHPDLLVLPSGVRVIWRTHANPVREPGR